MRNAADRIRLRPSMNTVRRSDGWHGVTRGLSRFNGRFNDSLITGCHFNGMSFSRLQSWYRWDSAA